MSTPFQRVAEHGLSIKEAHQRIGVGKTTLYALLAREELETIRIGRRRLVLAASVDAFIQRSIVQGDR